MLAMVVNGNACCLNSLGALESIASKPAPTMKRPPNQDKTHKKADIAVGFCGLLLGRFTRLRCRIIKQVQTLSHFMSR